MNTLLMALAVVASGQDAGLNAWVEHLAITAQPVEAVVKELAEISKEVLIVTGPIAREPIFIDLKNTTVQGAMDRIAEATYGSWKDENGAYTLIQGPDAAAASAKARQKRVDKVRETLQKRIGDLRKGAWGPGSAQETVKAIDALRDRHKNNFRVPEGSRPRVNISGMAVPGAIDQVVLACLEELEPERLVDMELGQRIVLSTRPNRMQQAVRGNLSRAMALFAQANAEIYDAAKSAPIRDFNADWEGSLGLPKQRDITVAKLNIVLLREGNSVAVEVQVVGPNGEDLGAQAVSIPFGEIVGQAGFEVPPGSTPSNVPEQNANQKKIELSEVSQEFLNISGNFGQRGSMSMAMRMDGGTVRVDAGQAPSAIKPTAALSEFLNRPGQKDFLGLLLPEALKAVTDSKDYVAIIPDDIWARMAGRFQGESVPMDDFAKMLDAQVEIIEGENGLTLRPLDPLVCQAGRANRTALQTLTDKVHRAGFGHIKDVAEYVMNRRGEMNEMDADALLLSVSLPFVTPMLMQYPPMTPAAAQFLYNSPNFVTEVPAGSNSWVYGWMNRPMQTGLEKMVFSRKIANMGYGTSISVTMGDEEPRVPMVQDREPTERFPNGLPGDLTVSVNVFEQEGVLGRLRGHPTGQLMSALNLGAITGFIEGSGGANSELKITEFEEYLLANTRTIEVSYPGAISQSQFTDGALVPGARPMALSQLPASILEKGQSAREAIRNAAQNMNQGQGTAPPPP